MAYAGSELALPSIATSRANIGGTIGSFGPRVVGRLQKYWLFRRTLADLEGYSERALLDIGAEHGVEEFARRAAGL